MLMLMLLRGVKWKMVVRNLHTWRMSSILLRLLMVILMAGVIFIKPDVDADVDADADADAYAELM